MSALIFALLLFQSIANVHFIMISCILTSSNHPSVYLTMFGSDFIAEVKFDEQMRIYFFYLKLLKLSMVNPERDKDETY